jgi:hypothetical protein
MSDGIDFDLTGIGGELRDRLLAVPVYQRPYSWPEEQVKEFWSDLKSAFARQVPEYFLGTIVLSHESTSGRDTIIDGQQRLATTTLLLAAVRDEYARRADDQRSKIVQDTYITTSDLQSGQRVARLRLSSDDDAFFRKLLIEADAAVQPLRPSHALLLRAHALLQSSVTNFANEAGAGWADRLFALVEYLRLRVRAIFLVVPSEADAFLIFETLNDRGADLTIADLLKNYLFGRAGTQLNTVRDGWLQAVGAFEISYENATFTTFLRHYWSSRRGAIRERELYKNIRETITSENQTVDFVDDLQRAARLYAALLNTEHEFWSSLGTDAKNAVETFLRLDFEQVRPLMLAAMQFFPSVELKKLLRGLTNWGVRGLIVGGIGGGTYEKAYCDAAVKIRKGDIKTAADVFDELGRIIPTDEEFEAAFALARVPKSNLARYYLIALENAKRGDSEPEFVPNANEDQVNLEHVLPKNASDADWGASFTSDERKDWVFRLGNLTLLQKGPNGRIGSKPFSAKRPILAASAFELTSEIGAALDWKPSAIRERQERLAKLALQVWPRNV